MITPALLDAFCDELEKLGAMSDLEHRRRIHESYIKNRARNIQRGQVYRAQHSVELQRKHRVYNKKVKTRAIHQRRRVPSGSFSYSYIGFK